MQSKRLKSLFSTEFLIFFINFECCRSCSLWLLRLLLRPKSIAFCMGKKSVTRHFNNKTKSGHSWHRYWYMVNIPKPSSYFRYWWHSQWIVCRVLFMSAIKIDLNKIWEQKASNGLSQRLKLQCIYCALIEERLVNILFFNLWLDFFIPLLAAAAIAVSCTFRFHCWLRVNRCGVNLVCAFRKTKKKRAHTHRTTIGNSSSDESVW